jgi:hypothetical protein
MKKTILAIVLSAGLTSFAGSAKANIVFQDLNQTILAGQTFNFGFNGSTITSGIGGYSISFNAPETISGWWGTYTSKASVTLTTPGYPELIYQGSNYGGNYSINIAPGVSVAGLDGNGSARSSISFNEDNLQNIAIWAPIHNNIPSYSNYYNGWLQLAYNNNGAVLAAVAFATGGGASDILVGDTGNGYYAPTTSPNTVPEPSTYALFGLGALALIIAYRRKVA